MVILFRTLTVHFIIQLNQRRKTLHSFSNSIPRGVKMKHLNPQVIEGRTHLKAFPGTKVYQLNQYVI